MRTALRSIQQFLCSLRGHDELLAFERRRVFLRCICCGHQSVGWNLQREASHPEDPSRFHRSSRSTTIKLKEIYRSAL